MAGGLGVLVRRREAAPHLTSGVEFTLEEANSTWRDICRAVVTARHESPQFVIAVAMSPGLAKVYEREIERLLEFQGQASEHGRVVAEDCRICGAPIRVEKGMANMTPEQRANFVWRQQRYPGPGPIFGSISRGLGGILTGDRGGWWTGE